MATAHWNGAVIAKSDDTIVVEGNHYFPPESVQADLLEPSETHTVCGWKGTASYYTIVVDGQRNVDAAWFYPDTMDAAKHIQGRIAVWRGVEVTD